MAGAAQSEGGDISIALCLSGGGFRAALFHLGALRRLNELGILSAVDTISAVSGGSIVAAHLAERIRVWPQPGEMVPRWEEDVASPFRAFARRNLRTGPVLRRLAPASWRTPGHAVATLAARYEHRLTPLTLPALPDRPQFVFSATDMTYGVNWVFEKGRVGDFQAGYLSPAPDWPVARAVAASSCFPPVFDPMRLELDPGQLRRGRAPAASRAALASGIYLIDGGAYDNLGLEPAWKRAPVLLVSDGGAVFGVDPPGHVVNRLFRYTAIVAKQASAVRKRWLMASFATGRREGAYWGVGRSPSQYGATVGYPQELVHEAISRIRTDLDAFSVGEIAVLENHGYLLADAALQKYAPGLRQCNPALAIPHAEWMDVARVEAALVDSHRRRLLGRW